MRKLINLIIILIILTQTLFAQKVGINDYIATDKKALQLPDSLTKTSENIASYIATNFKTDKEKVRAIFIWVASNIQYDIENMYSTNFYAKKEDKISKPLKTRKGICENYAELFNDICLKSGIKSFVIEGYTKQKGFVDYIPHAWCAALIDSSWFMFDPTWGSGYINGGKFYKKINNAYFMATPLTLIKTHIPFDYLWQFLNYPISNQEFYENKTQENKTKPYFNYFDSIKVYEKQSHIDQLVSTAKRIEKNGIKNSMIFDRLNHIKYEIEQYKIAVEQERQNIIVNLYNNAVIDYNAGINYYNEFINYKNHQFFPEKTDNEIKSMIDAADNKLKDAMTKLDEIENPEKTAAIMIEQLTKSIGDITIKVEEEQDWLKKYLSNGKSGRKKMFYLK